MRRSIIAVTASALALSACVQTKQYADVAFAPPQGDYKLLVMRPDVTVGSVTTGGMTEPRADWTEAARANLITALKAQQASRGGNVFVLEKRDGLASRGVDADTVAELERLHYAVGSSIALHRYSGAYLPTKRGKGLDWTLGRGRRRAWAARPASITPCSSTPRTASPRPGGSRFRCSAWPAAWSASARPTSAAAASSPMPAWSTSGPAKWCGSTSLQTGTQIAGINMGDIRKPEGAAQMVERLLNRMKPGRDVRRALKAQGQ